MPNNDALRKIWPTCYNEANNIQNPIAQLPITIVSLYSKRNSQTRNCHESPNFNRSQSRVHTPKSPYSASSHLYLIKQPLKKSPLKAKTVLKTTPSS